MATIVAATGAAGNWTAGSAWVGGVAPTAADDAQITVSTTSITIDSGAVCRSADFNGCTGVVTHNAITFNIGDGTAGLSNIALRLASGMTYTLVNAATSAITLKSTSATQQTVTTTGKTIGNFVISGAGSSYILADSLTSSGTAFTYTAGTTFDTTTNTTTVTLNATACTITPTIALTFYNLTRTPTSPAKTDTFTLAGNITVSNLFTVSDGATVTNRVLVQSNTIGTARTITAASISISNADFMDITGAGAASWDMSAASGGSGNCGGNTMKALGDAAFTTAADQHYQNANGGNWSTSADWTSRVPLPQDDVYMNKAFGTSKTVTQDMPRMGRNIDWTGATWTTALTWTVSGAQSLFGNLTLISGLTHGNASSQIVTFAGRGSQTIQSFSVAVQPFTINAFGGSYTLLDNLTFSNLRGLIVTNGTFSAVNGGSNYAISTNSITVNAGGTLTLGSATHTMFGTTGSLFNVASGSATITASTGTLKFTGTLVAGITFAGAGKTFNNVWFSNGASTQNITITGSNTFADFKDDGTAAHSILFTAATTQTFTTFTVSGTAGNLITINSTTTATHALVKSGGGTISRDYLNIQHSVATPATTWYAGVTSVNNQGVATAGSGWIFTAPPVATNAQFLAFF